MKRSKSMCSICFIIAFIIFAINFSIALPCSLNLVNNYVKAAESLWVNNCSEVAEFSTSGITRISSEKQLAYLAKKINEGTTAYQSLNIQLMKNLNMGKHYWTPIKEFNGVFDGCGHSITGLKISNEYVDYGFLYGSGLFARTAGYSSTNKCEIKNLRLVDPINQNVKSNNMSILVGYMDYYTEAKNIDILNPIMTFEDKTSNAGTVAGTAYCSDIEGVRIKGINIFCDYDAVNEAKIGGVVGCALNVSIQICTNDGTNPDGSFGAGSIECYGGAHTVCFYVGGIVGYMGEANNNLKANYISKCYSTIDLFVDGSFVIIGGIAGYCYDAIIEYCYTDGNMYDFEFGYTDSLDVTNEQTLGDLITTNEWRFVTEYLIGGTSTHPSELNHSDTSTEKYKQEGTYYGQSYTSKASYCDYNVTQTCATIVGYANCSNLISCYSNIDFGEQTKVGQITYTYYIKGVVKEKKWVDEFWPWQQDYYLTTYKFNTLYALTVKLDIYHPTYLIGKNNWSFTKDCCENQEVYYSSFDSCSLTKNGTAITENETGRVYWDSADYSYTGSGEGSSSSSWRIIYSKDQTVKISCVGGGNNGDVTLNVPYKPRGGIASSISLFSLNDLNVWAVDNSINNGLPYIKDLYWQHFASTPSKG